ncbi:hypothetical protein HBA55_22925 [Pseudomaricurvus alkylphenolicus]|uniref:C45 family autoproteolytic acyltransferase/hydolase n=1 Tax=Pseudomaricurvus alkylphenolicus TaxID=1306991 RepID=UPI0014237335|nr:C45 family autoproteolytic acyltransferase/hydolase [Pseudomaricurvus alkylphenolicus]NIB42479.1 hypothetical protein [Pseudomaricurvus alkylphenolicus]
MKDLPCDIASAFDSEPLPRIHIEGTGRERGRGIGAAAADLIANNVNLWLERMGERTGCDLEGLWTLVERHSHLLYTARAIAADLLEEIRGMAEASAVSEKAILLYNLETELEWLVRSRGRAFPQTSRARGKSFVERDSCGQISLGFEFCCEVFDQPMGRREQALVLDIAERLHYPRQLLLTTAGKLSLVGVNAHGLAVCTNTLPDLDYSTRGLAAVLVARSLLNHASLESAERYLRAVPHASGKRYLCADGRRALSLECSAQGVKVRAADADSRRREYTDWADISQAGDCLDKDNWLAAQNGYQPLRRSLHFNPASRAIFQGVAHIDLSRPVSMSLSTPQPGRGRELQRFSL